MLEAIAKSAEDVAVDYSVFKDTEIFIHNLIVLPNTHFKKFKAGVTSKGVMTHVHCLTEPNCRLLRGMRWNSVTLVGVSEGMLKHEYPDIHTAISNGCVTMQTKMIEV